jgi:hypothetical protein
MVLPILSNHRDPAGGHGDPGKPLPIANGVHNLIQNVRRVELNGYTPIGSVLVMGGSLGCSPVVAGNLFFASKKALEQLCSSTASCASGTRARTLRKCRLC